MSNGEEKPQSEPPTVEPVFRELCTLADVRDFYLEHHGIDVTATDEKGEK